jgi:hypothetical protein
MKISKCACGGNAKLFYNDTKKKENGYWIECGKCHKYTKTGKLEDVKSEWENS